MADSEFVISPADKRRLGELARRVRDISQRPLNVQRRELWYAHDEGRADRPIVLVEHDGGLELVKPDLQLLCQEGWARDCERRLLESIVHFEELRDDRVIEPYVHCDWSVTLGDYGAQAVYDRSGQGVAGRGAYNWDPPVKDLSRAFEQLRQRTFSVDRQRTARLRTALQDVFEPILQVRTRGRFWWTRGMTQDLIFLIGLEQLMMAMYDHPADLHRLMAFLRDDHLALIDWLEAEGLFTLNNENDYIGSGSYGYTRRLPQSDGPRVSASDLWVLLESQETVGVGPAQFAEFIYPYQADIARRFGACYYGCCEPVHSRWAILRGLPGLRRVSVSPWCDQRFMAEALAGRFVFSRKPNPSLVSTSMFDEDAIRADLAETLTICAAAGCRGVEIIMKDVHTLAGQPNRLARWVELAREQIERLW